MTPIEKTIGTAATATGVGTVVMSWFDSHSAGIGAICAILTLVVYTSVSIIRLKREAKDEE